MARVKLCTNCREGGHCSFVGDVDQLIEDHEKLPPAETDEGQLAVLQALNAAIEGRRVQARGDNCPRVNYNPCYPGKERL